MQDLNSKPLRIYISEKAKPFLLWKRLRERYAVSIVATKVQLQIKLNRLGHTDQVMPDFVGQFKDIFNRLEGMAALFSEEEQVSILLSSIGDKSRSGYGVFVAAVQADLTWEKVTARLMQEYEEKRGYKNAIEINRLSKKARSCYCRSLRFQTS